MPGFAENALAIAKAGIYDLRSHLDDVVRPVLRFWGVFERARVSTAKELARETNWRHFSIWWKKRPLTTTSVAKNDWSPRHGSIFFFFFFKKKKKKRGGFLSTVDFATLASGLALIL